jgi:hypothetical protein
MADEDGVREEDQEEMTQGCVEEPGLIRRGPGGPGGRKIRERVYLYQKEFTVATDFAKRISEEIQREGNFDPCIVRRFCEIMVK